MAKRRTASTAGRVRPSSLPVPASAPVDGVPTSTAGSVYDDQSGLTIGRTADPGRFDGFPQFGQISRSGLLPIGGLMGGASAGGAGRVYNPERVSLSELDEMSLDPVIRSCLLGYTLILQTAELSVSCADASMKALIESQFLPRMPQLIRETVRPAMIFGWADAEILWQTLYNVSVEVDAGEMHAKATPGPDNDPGDQPVRVFPYVTTIKDFVPLDNSTLTLRQTLAGDFAGAVQWGWGEAFLPPSKLFHMPLGAMFRNPYGESTIKGCYPFWYWTRFLYEMLMVATEGCAVPPVIGRYPMGYRVNVDGGQIDAGDYMMSMLANLRSFSSATLPSMLSKDGKNLFDITELPREAHIDWIMQGIAALNAQKQLYLFFPDKLLQSGDIGSYALAKEHTDLFSLAIQAKLDEILDHVNRGPLRQFVKFNDPFCPEAKLTYSAPNIQAMTSLATAVVQAITTGQALVTQNQDKILTPDWKRLADQFGIPYTIVRRMDGMDALGNPLQPGQDPDAQDHAAAQQAGMAPPGAPPSFGAPGTPPPGNPGVDGNGETAAQYLQRVLGVPAKAAQSAAQLWEGPDTDEGTLRASLSDAEFGAMIREQDAQKEHDAHYRQLLLSTLGLELAGADKVALAKSMFTSKQTDMLSHIYSHGPSTHEDLKAALPHIPYPHTVGGDLAAKGHLKKVKHPQSGKAAFEMTDSGMEALAQHLGWTGTPSSEAASAPEDTGNLKNSEANALHSLMTSGAQSPDAINGANSLHAHWPATQYDMAALHAAGHAKPTNAVDAKGAPTYAITSEGAQALAAHMGNQAATTAATPKPEAQAPKADTLENTVPAGLTPGEAAIYKHIQVNPDADGDGVTLAHYKAIGTASGASDAVNSLVAAKHITWGPEGYNIAPKADTQPSEDVPKGLSPSESVVYNHIKQNPGTSYTQVTQAHNASLGKYMGAGAAIDTLTEAGHITGDMGGYHVAAPASSGGKAPNAGEHKEAGGTQENPDETFHYEPGAAPSEAPAQADHAAPPADLPEGWKPISAKSDKGFKTDHEGKSAVVKPVGDKWQVAATDGRDIDVHPEHLETKEAAFAKAHEMIGKPPPQKPFTPPEGWTWGGKTVAGMPYHSHAENGHSAMIVQHGNKKWGFSVQGEQVNEQGEVDTPHEAIEAAQQHLSTIKKPESAGADITDDNLPKGWTKHDNEGTITYTLPGRGGPTGAEIVKTVQNQFIAFAPVEHEDKFSDAPTKVLDTLSEAIAWSHEQIGTPVGETKAADATSDSPAHESAPPEPEQPAVPHHVTIAGKKQALSDDPTTQSDIDTTKVHPDYNLSDKAKTDLQSAYDASKLKTHSDLHQALAIGEAANKTASYSHMTATSLQAGIDSGGVKALKEKADGGDATSKAYVDKLGDTSIRSNKEQAAAEHQKAQEAFQKSSIADLLHHKDGGAQGGNDGGFYTTSGGQKIYAKFYKNADQAHSEHLANALYNALGVSAPVSTVKTEGKKTVYASQIIPGQELGKAGLTKENAQDALKGATADMLLSNHDAAGLTLDNMFVGPDGKITRIDNGGSLEYRAGGKKKTQDDLDNLHEWENFAPGGKNPSYAKLFEAAGIDSMDNVPDIVGQIGKIVALGAQPGGWAKFISDHVPDMPKEDQERLAGILQKRTDLLNEKRLQLLDKQSGSLATLAGTASLDGSEGADNPFTAHVAQIDQAAHDTEKRNTIFDPIHAGFKEVLKKIKPLLKDWSASSHNHPFIDAWKETTIGTPTSDVAKKVFDVLEGRKQRWQKLADTLGIPLPQTFHLYRGMSGEGTDADAHIVPWVIASWMDEDEPYMRIKSHAAASWSTKQSVAQSFANWHSGQSSVVFETHVPFHQTLLDKFCDDMSLLTSHTHENEFICGGKENAIVCPKSTVRVKYAGKEYGYEDRQKLFDAYKDKHGSLPAPKTFGIDIAAHKTTVAQLSSLTLRRPTMSTKIEPEDGAEKPNDFLTQYHAQVAEWERFTGKLGTQAAPPDNSGVPAIGSFANDAPEVHDQYKDGGKPGRP